MDVNDRLRDLVSGIVGVVPTVGSALSGLVQFLWQPTETGPEQTWAAIRQDVENLIGELIDENRVGELGKRLDGIRQVADDYQNTSLKSPQKGQYFTDLIAQLDNAEPFFDGTIPQSTLSYFVPIYTLKLVVLREQALFYQLIYGQDDPDAASHLARLQQEIKKHSDEAQTARENARLWRRGKVTVSGTVTTVIGLPPSQDHTWTAFDALTHWSASWTSNSLTGGPDAEGLARSAYKTHSDAVENELLTTLDIILAPSLLWIYLDPTNPNRPEWQWATAFSGPFGGQRGQAFADVAQGRPVTHILVRSGTRVDGVELRYGGTSAGLHGGRSGGVTELELAPDEWVVKAHGRAGDSLDQLYFETNKSRTVGGGGGGGSAWSAAPPGGTGDAHLVSISGVSGLSSLEGISFVWAYKVQK